MPAKKMRIELFDSEGNKYTIAFEGQITREKALRLLDMVELLGGVSAGEGNPGASTPLASDQLNKYNKVRMIIQKHFPLVWFSSRDVQLVYEQELKEPISLSTVATYLYRMSNKGLLAKAGASNRLKYRIMPTYPQILPKQQTPQ
ncbi:MAG: hypothetical protein QHH17_02655 [Candidatus Bathyarchaeota archaeon]|jgi:hypothetical protein|nr:hypothetical protein [Candidatus Bathyarchaeota archaeon]